MNISKVTSFVKKPVFKYGALMIGLAAVLSEGSCSVRRMCMDEPVDKFVRSMNEGIYEIDSKNYRIADFVKAFNDYREPLKESLGMSDEKYDWISKILVGVANEETDFGLGDGYVCKANTPLLAKLLRLCVLKTGPLSKGLTNIKIDKLLNGKNSDIKDKLKEFGITSKNIYEPKNCAIASMILSNYNSNLYKTYLNGAGKHHPEKLTREEHLCALWIGYPLDVESDNPKKQKSAKKHMREILADRTPDKKTKRDYVWKVLDSLGYVYDSENDCCVLKNSDLE